MSLPPAEALSGTSPVETCSLGQKSLDQLTCSMGGCSSVSDQ